MVRLNCLFGWLTFQGECTIHIPPRPQDAAWRGKPVTPPPSCWRRLLRSQHWHFPYFCTFGNWGITFPITSTELWKTIYPRHLIFNFNKSDWGPWAVIARWWSCSNLNLNLTWLRWHVRVGQETWPRLQKVGPVAESQLVSLLYRRRSGSVICHHRCRMNQFCI